MGVNGALGEARFALVDVLVDDEVAGVDGGVRGAVVVRKDDADALSSHFFLEKVAFVEKNNEWFPIEKLVVDDVFEKPQTLVHAVDGVVFGQDLVVLAQADDEEDGGDVVEAVDPLLPL